MFVANTKIAIIFILELLLPELRLQLIKRPDILLILEYNRETLLFAILRPYLLNYRLVGFSRAVAEAHIIVNEVLDCLLAVGTALHPDHQETHLLKNHIERHIFRHAWNFAFLFIAFDYIVTN